jgi:hypothetical protein
MYYILNRDSAFSRDGKDFTFIIIPGISYHVSIKFLGLGVTDIKLRGNFAGLHFCFAIQRIGREYRFQF